MTVACVRIEPPRSEKLLKIKFNHQSDLLSPITKPQCLLYMATYTCKLIQCLYIQSIHIWFSWDWHTCKSTQLHKHSSVFEVNTHSPKGTRQVQQHNTKHSYTLSMLQIARGGDRANIHHFASTQINNNILAGGCFSCLPYISAAKQ